MRILAVEAIPEDTALARQWNALVLRSPHPEVFYTYEWSLAVSRSHKEAFEPLLCLAYDQERLTGVVAFARPQAKPDEISFLTATTADYCDFLSAPEHRSEFIAGVLSELKTRGVTKFRFPNLPADSASVGVLQSISGQLCLHRHSRRGYLCARVVLGSEENRFALKQSVTGKKRLRRNLRELSKHGDVRFLDEKEWHRLEPLLLPFCRAHVARFLATGRISNLIDAERRAFLHELARQLSTPGWVSLSRLLVAGETIAWNYGFQFEGSWFWYQPTVASDRKFSDFSPGYCLLAHIIENACTDPRFEVVDLGLGAEEYKDRFATANRETLYTVLNDSWIAHAQTVIRYRVAKIAKMFPRAERGIRFFLSACSKLQQRALKQSPSTLLRGLASSAWRSIASRQKILFFERTVPMEKIPGYVLQPLNSDLLGAAAIRYAENPETLQYLIRAAKRYSSGLGSGFALLGHDGIPTYFCWSADVSEIYRTRSESVPMVAENAAAIFDCFTPGSSPERSHAKAAISTLAAELEAAGRSVWFCCDAGDRLALESVQPLGFSFRFSVPGASLLAVSGERANGSSRLKSAKIAPPVHAA